jgi:hypothetical protein
LKLDASEVRRLRPKRMDNWKERLVCPEPQAVYDGEK